MSNQELFGNVFAPRSRRRFLEQAAALGVSSVALAAFLEACGSTTTSTTTTTGSGVNMAGPIDMQTLITNAKKEGKLQAIGIPPEWADYKDILAGYAAKYVPVQYQAEAEFSSAQELEVFVKSKSHGHVDIV